MKAPKILLIDDLADSLTYLILLLKRHLPQAKVFTAGSGQDGLALAKSEAVDLILLDVKMPQMDGFETCRRLKMDAATANVPVLMVSGVLIDTKNRVAGMECGADGYLCKPFESLELIAQVGVLLRIKQNEDALRRHKVELEEELASRTQQLRESEQQFRILFEKSPDAVFVEDEAGIVLDVNPAACRLHELNREELVGKHVADLLPPGEREKVLADFPKWFTGEREQYEGYSYTRSGKAVPVEIRANRVDYCGKEAVIFHVRDITERKVAEDRQAKTIAGLRAVVEIADELIGSPDMETLFRRAVELAHDKLKLERCRILVEQADELRGTFGVGLKGETVDERNFSMPMDEEWRRQFILRSAEDKAWHAKEGEHWCWDGAGMRVVGTGWVVVTPILSAREVMGMFCNDTARSRGDIDPIQQEIVSVYCSLLGNIIESHAVEAERSRLATAVEQSVESVIITNNEGEIQYVNPGFERMTGYSRHEAIGQTPRMLKSGKQDATFYQRLWASLKKGDVWAGRVTNRRKDGRMYEVDMTISPVRDRRGVITNYISVSQDVTRAVQLETELRQSQKLESIGRLAGGVAHDFNNLLTAILGFGRLVQISVGESHPIRSDVDEIIHAGERAAKLTKQLLAFGSKQVIYMMPIDLNSVVLNMDQILRRTLGEDIELVTIVGENLGGLEADTGLMEQIIMNLAVNARDAMPQGGKLIIQTGNILLDEEYCQNHVGVKPGEYIMLSVRDNGTGMTDEVRERAFEPFYTTKEKGKGTGLGLATIYGIVTQCHGYIELETELGVGTEFKIYFPRVEAKPTNVQQDAKIADLRGAGNILLVEDENAVRALAVQNLTSLGYHVIEARNGEEALRLYLREKEPIDLVLTDVVMPQMGGNELIEKLRTYNADIKVLYMTGFTENVVLNRDRSTSNTSLLLKPFTREILAQAVQQAMGNGNS